MKRNHLSKSFAPQSSLYRKNLAVSSEPAGPITDGPVALRKKRQLAMIYGLLCMTASGLIWITASPSLHHFALGLILPGGGFLPAFLAHPGWDTAMPFLGGILAFVSAVFLWFATGNVILPPTLWFSLAIWSAFVGSRNVLTVNNLTPIIIVSLVAVFAIFVSRLKRISRKKRAKLTTQIAAQLVKPIAQPAETPTELSDADLARLRLLLDRALQPVGNFDGFERRDQFQTAALRYQINFISYALSMTQARYMPAFKGYMHEAQDNLTAKQQDPRIWRYWKLENLWGNLRRSGDPLEKDNIMYSGFVAAQLMYRIKSMNYPNDAAQVVIRCEESGSIVHQYSLKQIIQTLADQYKSAEFGLLPCEPNWIYPLCNAITSTAIKAYDSLGETTYWDEIAERFRTFLETEFVAPNGQLVPFRSSYTGIAPPAVGGAVLQAFPCLFMNAVLPENARRHWVITQIARGGRDWKKVIWPADVGNYGLSRAAGYAASAAAAKEMGDYATASALLASLETELPDTLRNGIAHRPGASLWAHANEVFARAACANALQRLVVDAPQPHTPYIKSASYPSVLVAKAIGTPDALECVLVPGEGPSTVSITIAGLSPFQTYGLRGLPYENITTNLSGEALLTFPLDQRTRIQISKTQ